MNTHINSREIRKIAFFQGQVCVFTLTTWEMDIDVTEAEYNMVAISRLLTDVSSEKSPVSAPPLHSSSAVEVISLMHQGHSKDMATSSANVFGPIRKLQQTMKLEWTSMHRWPVQ